MKINLLRNLNSLDVRKNNLFPLDTYLFQGDDILSVPYDGKKQFVLPKRPDNRYVPCAYTSSKMGFFARYLTRSEANLWDSDGIIQVFDESLALKATIRETGGEIVSLDFDRTGNYMTAMFRDRVSVYQINLGKKLWTQQFNGAVSSEIGNFSDYIIGVRAERDDFDYFEKAEIFVWELKSGNLLYSVPLSINTRGDSGDPIIEKCYALGHQDKILVCLQNEFVTGYNFQTGKQFFSEKGRSFATSANTPNIAIIDARAIRLFNHETNSYYSLDNHTLRMEAIAFEPDAKYLVGINRSHIWAYDISAKSQIVLQEVGRSHYYNIAFHEDGRHIVAAGAWEDDEITYQWYYYIYLFEMSPDEDFKNNHPARSGIENCTFSIKQVWNEDSAIKACKWGRTVDEFLIWNDKVVSLRIHKTGQSLFSFADNNILDAFVSPARGILSIITADMVKQISLSTGKISSQCQLHQHRVFLGMQTQHDVFIDKEHEFLASVDKSDIIICKASNAEIRHRLIGHTDKINHLSVNSQGRILSSSNDATLMLWDSKTGTELRVFMGNTHEVWLSGFTSVDSIIYSVASSELKFWDLASARELHVAWRGGISAVTAHPTLPLVALSRNIDEQTYIDFIDIYSGEKLGSLNLEENIDCTALSFSQDGKHLLVAGNTISGYREIVDDVYSQITGNGKIFVVEIQTKSN